MLLSIVVDLSNFTMADSVSLFGEGTFEEQVKINDSCLEQFLSLWRPLDTRTS